MNNQHPIRKQLERDHYNMLRLWHAVRECLELVGWDYPTCQELVAEALEYAHHYPEQWHHPLEEALFDLLSERSGSCREMAEHVAAEHRSMDLLTQELTDLCRRASAFEGLQAGAASEIRTRLLSFIDLQIKHIDRENQLLYPLLELYVSAQDWRLFEVSWDAKPLCGTQQWRQHQRALEYALMLADSICYTHGLAEAS